LTVTLVQTVAGHSTTLVNTLTVTLFSPATAGNCLVVCAGARNANVVTGVTSSGSADNWASAATADAGAITSEIWADPHCGGGNTTVTVLFTVSGLLAVQVFEFAGVAVSPADVTAPGGLSIPPVSSWSSGSTGTAQAGDVVIGSCCGFEGSGVYTLTGPSSPWVNEPVIATSGSGFFVRLIAGYQVLSGSAAATYSGTSGAPQSYGAVAIALKSASGGGVGGSTGSFLPFFP
jgi:hypothetical protein